MKSKTLTKIIVALLSLSLILCTGIVASAADAEDATAAPLTPTENGPEIVSQNIAYNGYFGLVYAIDAASVLGGSVKVNIYDAEMNYLDSFAPYKQETIVTVGGTTYTDAYLVETSPVAAKDMADQYYAQAVDAEGNVGELKRYSVAEYVFQMLYANGINEATDGTRYNQKLFLTSLLEFGSHAQTVLINDKLAEGETPEALVNTYKYLRVNEGCFEGGYTTAVCPVNSEITVTYTGTDSNCTGWTLTKEDGTATEVVGNTVTVTDHMICTPIIEDPEYRPAGTHNGGAYYNSADASAKKYDGSAVAAQSGSVDVVNEVVDDNGNAYIYMYRTGNTASVQNKHLRPTLPTDMTNVCNVVEMDIAFGNVAATHTAYIDSPMNGYAIRMYFGASNGKVVFHNAVTAGSAYEFDTDTWYNLRFEIYSATEIKMYVNNEWICDITGLDTTKPNTTNNVLVYMQKNKEADLFLCYDNIYIGYKDEAFVAGNSSVE